jgi:putative acetyltransferase
LKNSTIKVRPETMEDLTGIRAVEEAAFGRAAEADLVDLCRQRGNAALSLVAVEAGRVTGHILFTPVSLDPLHPGWLSLGVGPVAVLPELQRMGIGSRLMTIGLEICRQRGVDYIILLGSPAYYSRFGFIPGREFGLSSDYGDGDEFQVRELVPGVLRGAKACAKYVPEFKETGC